MLSSMATTQTYHSLRVYLGSSDTKSSLSIVNDSNRIKDAETSVRIQKRFYNLQSFRTLLHNIDVPSSNHFHFELNNVWLGLQPWHERQVDPLASFLLESFSLPVMFGWFLVWRVLFLWCFDGGWMWSKSTTQLRGLKTPKIQKIRDSHSAS